MYQILDEIGRICKSIDDCPNIIDLLASTLEQYGCIRRMKKYKKKEYLHTVLPHEFDTLMQVFNSKGWLSRGEYSNSITDKFLHLLSLLSGEEKDLIINLTRRYRKVFQEEYTRLLFPALISCLEKQTSVDRIFIMPLAVDEHGNVKSYHHVYYLFTGDELDNSYSGQISLKALTDVSKIPLLTDRDRIVLVDDFIGTGDTATARIISLRKQNENISLDNIWILCIIAMEQGLKKLTALGVHVIYHELAYKGISDHFVEEDQLFNSIRIMENIEHKMKKRLKSKYKFGYGRSEALVTLARTPNNTFPIYWLSGSLCDDYEAPFKR